MTLSISWSSLRVHEECRQKSMLKRHKKKAAREDVRNFVHGNVVDLIMRAWLEDEDRQPNTMPDQVPAMFESYVAEIAGDGQYVKWRGLSDKDDLIEFCRELLIRLEPLLEHYVLPYEFQPELRFSKVPLQVEFLTGEPTIIHLIGGIDILTRRPDGSWVAYDLKATKDRRYHRKVLGQAYFYDLAIECMFGEPTTSFQFLQPMVEDEPVVAIEVSPQDRADIARRVQNMVTDIWRSDFRPKSSIAGCSWCDVKHACERFRPVGSTQTLRIGAA